MMTILNVAGRGDSLTIRRCAEIAQATIKRAPSKAAFHAVLRLMWKFGISSIPPDALPYLIGSYTMDTSSPATVPRSRLFAGDSVHGGGRAEGQF